MNTMRYVLLDKIIQHFGFEAKITIEFAEMVENSKIPFVALRKRYVEIVSNPLQYMEVGEEE